MHAKSFGTLVVLHFLGGMTPIAVWHRVLSQGVNHERYELSAGIYIESPRVIMCGMHV